MEQVEAEVANKAKSHILIEQMLFGDFRVNVWDERLNSMLDREYFCRGYESALMTALLVKQDLYPDLEIKNHVITL